MEVENFENIVGEQFLLGQEVFTEEDILLALKVVQKLLQWEREAKSKINASRNNATIELKRQTN